MTTELDIPSPSYNTFCNDYTTIKQSSLLNWINLHFNVSSLEQLKDLPTLSLFIQSLYNSHKIEKLSLNENNIHFLLNEINLIIPVNTIIPHNTIDVSAYLNGDQEQLIVLLNIIQTQHQAYNITNTILKNQDLSFTAHNPQLILYQLQDVRNSVLKWSNYVLSDYIGASLIPPLTDFTVTSWQSGTYLLAIIHYHNSSLIPDLYSYYQLSTVFQLIFKHYKIPILFNPLLEDKEDESAIITYLLELIPYLDSNNIDTTRRHSDIENFKKSLNHSKENGNEKEDCEKSTTFTSTYTLQQLKITKTTISKYSDGTDIPTDLEEFEFRATNITEKLNGLQHRLMLNVPTRSSNYSLSSVDSMEFSLTDDNTTASTYRHNENSSHAGSEDALQFIQQQQMIRILHPLQAREEDYSNYDRNFKSLQSEFQTLTDGDLFLLQTYVMEELAPVWRNHPKVVSRKTNLLLLHKTLSNEFEKSEITLSNFRRGFAFARMCSSIRYELDLIQNRMVKSITTNYDIEELENHMSKTTSMVDTLRTNFNDLLIIDIPQEDNNNNATVVDTSYSIKFESISKKNDLVRAWVEEVRVWFAEAARIRYWIEIRVEILNSTTIPDPLNSLEVPASTEQVRQFNKTHALLEKEIELFDKEDMTRLRSHVKTLTGSDRADKDLSPADTTTIGITLTTLTTLDKLTHSLGKKSYDLQVLTRRVLWEEEFAKTMDWLKETDNQVDNFIKLSARWILSEEDVIEDHLRRERLMEKEKQKEVIVQHLLTLERKMTEFDQGQFTKTVDSFQDLDNTSRITLPNHLESRQDNCEQLFEDLMKRMTFARNVVEQRLNVMDFLYQTEMLMHDAKSLQSELLDAKTKAHPGDNDREITAYVQNINERIMQLVTSTANRIPYPIPSLLLDQDHNTKANQDIKNMITEKSNNLILLSEDLDEQLYAFRDVLRLHKSSKEYLGDATRLCDWADERIKIIRKAKIDMHDIGALTVDDLRRLERDRDNIHNKLQNGKENEVVDLLTRIQLLLETVNKLNILSIDNEGLIEISQQLEERFDRLQQILEEHEMNLQDLRKKLEDGNTYIENVRLLRNFVSETRNSIPGLKQTCGFMTGQSEEQDKRRLDMLHSSLSKISSRYKEEQTQFNQLCSRFSLMILSKVENMEEICDIQQELESDWMKLSKEIKDLKSFSQTVGEWYSCQRRLSLVENQLLAGLNEEVSHLAKSGWIDSDLIAIQEKIQAASEHLKETGAGINGTDNKEDPLQTANYSCARERHIFLTNKILATSTNLKALKNNANKAMAYSIFLGETDKMITRIQNQKENIGHRMSTVGKSGFLSQSIDSIDLLCRNSQVSNAGSEKENAMLVRYLEKLLVTAKDLEVEGFDNISIQNPIDRIKDNLRDLLNTISLEKKQILFMRKIHIHAKAANDLQTWIDHCSDAISELSTDVCMNDEQELKAELDVLWQKVNEMRPTVQAFEAMESRIFTVKDGSQLDFCEISLERDEVKNSVRNREAVLLNSWASLEKQHQQARHLLNNSKRSVEIARKVKNVLTQVGDMKDRVGVIRICRNSSANDDIKNQDLEDVLSCPLTSIPTEHRLASAKAELMILDRDIESRLQPSIQELDIMLSSMNKQGCEDIFSGQRAEITTALLGLTNLLRNKRKAISEAEKMESFLTVMEELDVLLLAIKEVISRGNPSNARIVDGKYSRTDLQALLIDLDTRYRYYEPKIDELLDELKQVSEDLMDDRRVVDCIKHLSDKWCQLQIEAGKNKADLMSRIGPLGNTFDTMYGTEGLLQEREKSPTRLLKKKSAPLLKQHPSPQSMTNTPRYMTGYTRTTKTSFTSGIPPPEVSTNSSKANVKRSIGGSPTARRVVVRQMAAQQQRQRSATKTPENYVADPQNDLDVALGDILNDSPYKIQVKMVPGEVGKYWFGNINPKLAYCRILRSRMVMVRVGGGWVELSQFLSDHALLEDGNFVPGKSKISSSNSSVTRSVFINTTGRNSPHVTIRGGNGESPVLKESRSTPFHRGISPVPTYGHGIKTGNKFLVTLDDDGNRVEVKMTKANSKDLKSITRRMNF